MFRLPGDVRITGIAEVFNAFNYERFGYNTLEISRVRTAQFGRRAPFGTAGVQGHVLIQEVCDENRTSRRGLLATTAMASAAAAALPGCGVTEAQPPRQRARGNPFAGVRDIDESLRRIPSDAYPLPFNDQEMQRLRARGEQFVT